MPPKGKYTDPKLRDQVKEEIHNSDKGGAPGQWSARKAQMMAKTYKEKGGGYTTDKETGQDESQKHLSKWGDEDWQTKEGSANAKKNDGTQKRYLPKKAWEQMSDKEKEETDAKKQSESKDGKQFVGNTDKAKNARKKAEEDQNSKDSTSKKSRGKHSKDKTNKDEQADQESESEDEESENQEKASAGQKRKKSGASDTPSKKQKDNSKSKTNNKQSNGTVGSKHDPADPPAPAGSNKRLPKVGQSVSWKALPGWVHGKVIEIVREEKDIEGKHMKGSKDQPRIALKTDSGKIAVHKPEACHFED